MPLRRIDDFLIDKVAQRAADALQHRATPFAVARSCAVGMVVFFVGHVALRDKGPGWFDAFGAFGYLLMCATLFVQASVAERISRRPGAANPIRLVGFGSRIAAASVLLLLVLPSLAIEAAALLDAAPPEKLRAAFGVLAPALWTAAEYLVACQRPMPPPITREAPDGAAWARGGG